MSDLQHLCISFINFLKHPSPNKRQFKLINSNKNIIINIVVMLFIMFFFVTTSTLLIKMFFFIIDFNEASKLYEYQVTKLHKYTILQNVTYILLFGPLIEEILIRLFLNLKRRNLIISLICSILIYTKSQFNNFEISSICNLIILICLLFFSFKLSQFKIYKFGIKYYTYIFYFSCIIFGYLHIGNFQKVLDTSYFWLLPFFIIPQIIMGVFFGFIRLKYGFRYSVLFHTLINIPAIISYILTL